jgi:hypothetical protein
MRSRRGVLTMNPRKPSLLVSAVIWVTIAGAITACWAFDAIEKRWRQ